MDNDIIIALVGLGGTIVGVIGQIVIAFINRPTEKTGSRLNLPRLGAILLMLAGILALGWYFGFQVVPYLNTPRFADALARHNVIRSFDCESIEGWDEVIAFDTDWQGLAPPRFAPAPRTSDSAGAGNRLCLYDLPVDDSGLRHFTMTYPEPVRAEVVMVRFWLPDTGGALQGKQAAIVALDASPQAPPFGPRLAESIVNLEEGRWTLAVLDLRDRRDFDGRLITAGVFRLQLVISLHGAEDISAETIIPAGFDDILLLGNVGASPLKYASAGLSAFIPPRPMSLDAVDFRWQGSAEERYRQAGSPELIRTSIGGVTGEFIRYPVSLRSIAEVDRYNNRYFTGVQEAVLERPLRLEEKANLDTVLMTVFIESALERQVAVIPVLQMEDGTWVSGFSHTIPTNTWATVVWRRVVDSTNYSPEFLDALTALRDSAGIRATGYIRLVHYVLKDTAQLLRFAFRMDSNLEPGIEDSLEATIYVGNITFLP
ncbi:MAG: hypothetical protein HPY64_09285 [Anaerolineae bacterium]|nr:hypothetical protein [Anaerolineae bacterium]